MTVVEVFADIACPFTHVGLRRFAEQRRRLDRPEVVLWVRAWPLEIVNGAPSDRAHLAAVVDGLRRQVAPELFQGFTEAALPASTQPALALVAAGYRQDLALGERLSFELRDLLFEQGVDVADPAILGPLAAAAGLPDTGDPAAVSRDHREGLARGVTGSPHFFTPAGDFFCPALDITRDEDGLRIVPDQTGFERFLAACFAPAAA